MRISVKKFEANFLKSVFFSCYVLCMCVDLYCVIGYNPDYLTPAQRLYNKLMLLQMVS
jgi:hypothetical protein